MFYKHLCHSLIDRVGHPISPYLQNIITSKLFQLESWTFNRMFTLHHASCVTCHLLCVIPHMSHFIEIQRNYERKKTFQYKITHLVFIQSNEEFKKVCQFCNEDIVMKSLVLGMTQNRKKLRSLNLHLTKKHQVARKKRVVLLVGDISLKEQEFLEFSLEQYFVHIWATFLQMFVVLFVAISFIQKESFWSI